LRKYFKFFVLSLLAVLILWYFGRSLDWVEVWQSLRRADIWQVALATLIICLGYLLRAFRWRTLLAPITESNLRDLFATTTIGFASVFLFGRAGEVVRPLWLPMRDRRVRPSAALVTIGLERICDLTAIALLFALNLLWFRAPAGREAEFILVNRAGLLMLAGTFAGIIFLVIFGFYSEKITVWFGNLLTEKRFLPKSLTRLFLSLMQNLAASLRILRDPKELALTVFWTATLWFSISIPTYLVLAAFGLPLSFSDTLFVMGWAVVGSLVPTPGGAAGAFHATTAAALIFMNVNRSDAAATAIVLHLVYFAPALFFGIYYFLHGDISWTRFRSLVIADDNNKELRIENGELRNASGVGSN
jgi:glycosyltransferase 2 family protein